MFNLSYTRACEIKGDIKVTKPIMTLGNVTDVNGTKWNIHGIFGAAGKKQMVWATPLSDLHPYYSDTSMTGGYGLVMQSWEPYTITVVEETNGSEN